MYSFITSGNYVIFRYTEAVTFPITALNSHFYEHDVFKLHNTSKCIDWNLPEDTTKITFTIDEKRYENIPLASIDFDGSTCGNQQDFIDGLQAMFENLAGGGSSSSSSYLVYSALVKQPNASAPVAAKSYQDDFTGLTWGRVGAGQYYAGAIGQFTIAKTVIPPFGDGGQINMPILDGGGTLIGYYTLNTADDGDYINLIVINVAGTPTELSSLIGNNGTIFIEIRVYP